MRRNGGQLREEDAQRVEAVAPAVERERGLELRDRLREMGRVGHGNVGRIRDDEVEERPRGNAESQSEATTLTRGHPVAARVRGGEREGRRGAIDRETNWSRR